MNEKQIRTMYAGLLGLVVLTIIAGAASAYFVAPSTSLGNESEQDQINIITVSGTGTITMPPDEVTVYLGVQTTSNDAATAQKLNAEKMEQVIKALQDAGIAKDDMETSGYSIYPVRDYYYGAYPVSETVDQGITSYVVSNQLKVSVKDIDNVGSIIDSAVAAGANEVNSVSFTLSDETRQKAREQALKNAVKAAELDADTLADVLGVRITGAIQAGTSGGSFESPALAMEYAVAESRSGTPIQPGDVSVSAYVSVTYQFE
jgi:uncharacterized protein YggE